MGTILGFIKLINISNFKLLVHSFKNESLIITTKKVINKTLQINRNKKYQLKIKQDELSKEKIIVTQNEILHFKNKPFFSIITPIYNTDENHLKSCISSVDSQIYQNWEHILANDASTSLKTSKTIKELKLKKVENRMWIEQTKNLGISLTTNTAISYSKGQYVVFLDHDDCLHPLSLYYIARHLNTNSNDILVYTDEDLINEKGLREQPTEKRQFDIAQLRKYNYINHLLVIRKDVGDQLGWFRHEYENAQDYDLILRIWDRYKDQNFNFVPQVCYHWRKSKDSISSSPTNKPNINNNALKALQDHLNRNSLDCKAIHSERFGWFEIISK